MMVEAIIAAGLDASVRGIKFPPANVEQLKRTQLHELISSTTTAALLSIGLDVALLNGIDPENWSDCPHFQQAANVVKCLKVVNDTAERSIALMPSFNQSITKSEAEMQKLIQVVKDNRERIPDSSKASLASAKLATK
ncbi:polycystic kidney disease protein 1-like 2 [Biomphalaria pfeifferi]|uniref:Polycystic kidney disease protein 1-like 2 n=1 Tax=Biomphalaria pfeifferi TaxID=112525 RepID=A0AAD8B6R4_BIOPF|nr:polycystic kidney disease protein 1-like 2 [Biomphalaria pfeifferi]